MSQNSKKTLPQSWISGDKSPSDSESSKSTSDFSHAQSAKGKSKTSDVNNNKSKGRKEDKSGDSTSTEGRNSPSSTAPGTDKSNSDGKMKSTVQKRQQILTNLKNNLNVDCPDLAEIEELFQDTSKVETDLSIVTDHSDSDAYNGTPPSPNEKNDTEKIPVRACFREDYEGSKVEDAILPDNASYKELYFTSSQTCYPVKGERQRSHNKVIRARSDPWRRYGVMLQIYKNGGYVQTNYKKGANRQTKFIKPGTKPPPAPKDSPIMTLDQLLARPVVEPASSKPTKAAPNPLEDTSPDALSDDQAINNLGKKEKKGQKKETKK
ncbi:unnamed protein product [Bursaphelenchus okinawaensis]|uniref:Uncharacterized protein n=1 Tax=Bursaphelenchus okinawaensis TaxID=465554 RepID=A0A811K9A4_9BILA|nr:unnamed protein product [Bursaphelenchus okinawaensis]CAG9096980.1 unnamed protein product [Bursaphelenchus okinawaensis]